MRLKVSKEQFWNDIINKELEKYNVTYQELKEKYGVVEYNRPEIIIEGTNWFEYYTFDSSKEFKNWKTWVIEYLKVNMTPKLSKIKLENIFNNINLFIGLKTNY